MEFIKPTKQEILDAAGLVALKDTAIVAAAKKAEVDLLVTLDKKHLLEKKEIVENLGVKVASPQDAIKNIRGSQ